MSAARQIKTFDVYIRHKPGALKESDIVAVEWTRAGPAPPPDSFSSHDRAETTLAFTADDAVAEIRRKVIALDSAITQYLWR